MSSNLIRVAKQFGFTIGDPNVLKMLSSPNDFKEIKDQYDYFQKNLDQIPSEFHHQIRTKTISSALLQFLLSDQSDEIVTDTETNFIQILDAFTNDKLVIEKSRGNDITLKKVSVKRDLDSKLGNADDAISMHRQHYQNIQSLLNDNLIIVSSNSLLGTKNHCQMLCRLGRPCFDSTQMNIFWAEDIDGKFRVDLTKWLERKQHGFGMFCVGTFMIMSGEYDQWEKLFLVHDIYLPDLDANKLKYLKTNYKLSRYGLSLRQVENILQVEDSLQSSEFMLVLQDVHLDDPNVMSQLSVLFEGYSQCPPTLFLFIGSFTSKDHQHYSRREYKALFQNLAILLANGPGKSIVNESMFVFVPGPNDATLTADVTLFPRGPIPNYYAKPLKEKLPSNSVHFASNPAHIRFLSKDIVIYRDNIVQKLMRHTVVHPDPAHPLHVHVAKTIYSCAHLAPLDQSNHPTFWKYDHAMQLLPCPDTVILSDRSPSFFHTENDVHFVNPSSFSRNFSFVEFYPLDNRSAFKKLT